MCEEMRWKLLCEEKPIARRWYVVINSTNEMKIRYYDKLYTEGLKSKKVISDTRVKRWPWAWDNYECDKQEPFYGFISDIGGSTLLKEPVYYMELPSLPEDDEISRLKGKIYELEQKLKRLEREAEQC